MERIADLENEQERLAGELSAARARLEGLTERRARAQEGLAALRADREAAGAVVVDPDDKQAAQRRRQLRDAEDLVADFDGAVRGAEARVGELAQAEERLTRKLRTITARTEIQQHLKLAAILDAKWRPFLAELHEFLESASDVAALTRPLVSKGMTLEVSGPMYAAVLLWRLSEPLDLQGKLHDVLHRSSRVSLHEFEANRFRHVLETIDNILAD